MKSSQNLPGPQSSQGQVTGGVAPPDPSGQGAALPKPAYSGVDVSPAITPLASQPQVPMVDAMGERNPPQAMFNHVIGDPGSVSTRQGALAQALRSASPRVQQQPAQSKPSWQSMGGWQSLMQRMRPQ